MLLIEYASRDGSGSLDHDELRQLMLRVEPSMSLKEVSSVGISTN